MERIRHPRGAPDDYYSGLGASPVSDAAFVSALGTKRTVSDAEFRYPEPPYEIMTAEEIGVAILTESAFVNRRKDGKPRKRGRETLSSIADRTYSPTLSSSKSPTA